MPRRTLQPIPRSLATARDPTFRRQNAIFDQGWERFDQVQILGGRGGHDGCVNALSWSDDGLTLLSGSDDRRICIWGPDSSSDASTSYSPHPLQLLETITTGHRANIFSAKYLPNTPSPTIVTCAGDREVRVFDVERLSRMDAGSGRADLDGRHGPGVQVLRCHHDRTKRIATENSPFLFLTVSEDGTVRQHDLRRPHRCQSECPEPLFHAPRGVDLYSLSVSTVTPHIFAVAGRTDCAFICDRRMPEHQTPSWGPNAKSSGQVHCVRRLGLPEYEWKTVETTPEGRTIRGDRHITCVRMSPDKADEVICAFAHHSTALFSIHDDSTSSSARLSSQPIIAGSPRPKLKLPPPAGSASDYLRSPVSSPPSNLPSFAEAGPSSLHGEAAGSARSSPGKRRNSRSPDSVGNRGARPRLADTEDEQDEDDRREMAMESEGTMVTRASLTSDDEADEELERFSRAMDADSPSPASSSVHDAAQRESDPPLAQYINPSHRLRPQRPRSAEEQASLDEYMEDDDDDDEDMGLMEVDRDGYGDFEDEVDDEDEVDQDEFDEEDDDDEDEDGEEYGMSSRSDKGEYGAVEVVLPRRYFKGARNVETVKDCNFLGATSDKVASGSDDGNFFVWSKATGKLDGIWEGDGSVVNVMEQHPTLPLIAVSGIDNTVKIFGPPSRPLGDTRTKIRTSQSDAILEANMQSPQLVPRRRTLGHAGLMQLLASQGLILREGEADVGDAPPGCATQ